MLLSLALGVAPSVPARADIGGIDGVVHLPSPLAGVANGVKTTFQQSGCQADNPNVQAVQSTDGFAVVFGTPVREIDLAPSDPVGTPPTLPDLDIYFYDAGCNEIGSLATAAINEQCGYTEGLTPCPEGAMSAVVTMTAGADASFTLAWST
jgi:hypothetical protein